jgi:hypothetical protein
MTTRFDDLFWWHYCAVLCCAVLPTTAAKLVGLVSSFSEEWVEGV